jgi:hypothetical protein
VTEWYGYDGDGERAVRSRAGGATTYYVGALWEEATDGKRALYPFNGQIVAVRTTQGGTSALTYLHADHLGSVSVATNAGGAPTVQEYTPWGAQRGSGSITQTTLDYTGQRKDDTGLLYYHARYYDPVLGKVRVAGYDRPRPDQPAGSQPLQLRRQQPRQQDRPTDGLS